MSTRSDSSSIPTGLFRALLVVSFGFALWVCLQTVAQGAESYDAFWHLGMGRDLVEQGKTPWLDHYSISYQGTAIASPPVIFQSLLHLLVAATSVDLGLKLITVLGLMSAIALFYWRSLRLGSPPVFIVLATPFLVSMLCFRAFARPELLSFPLVVLAFLLYDKARHDFSPKSLLWIGLLLLFWVNHHNPIFGYIIFFGLFVDVAVDKMKGGQVISPSWGLWLGAGLALLAIGFLKFGGSHFLLEQLRFDQRWTEVISEYVATSDQYSSVHFFGFVWGGSALTLVWLILRQRWGYLIILLTSTAAFWQYNRLVGFSALTLVCILASLAAEEPWPDLLARTRRFSHAIVAIFLVAAFLGAIQLSLKLPQTRARFDFPEELAAAMQAVGTTGKVFNDYTTGGYLIHQFGLAGLDVFIDGRTEILYPFEHFDAYQRIATGALPVADAVREYGFDLVLWKTDPEVFEYWASAGFELDLIGSKFMLLSRQPSANLKAAGPLLVAPRCWSGEALGPKQLAELRSFAQQLPATSPLRADLGLLLELLAAERPRDLATVTSPLTSSTAIRLAAHLAALEGATDTSLLLLGTLQKPTFDDQLAAVIALLDLSQFDAAERVLFQAMLGSPYVSLQRNKLMVELIREIERNQPLQVIDPAIAPGIGRQLESRGMAFDNRELSPSLLCRAYRNQP